MQKVELLAPAGSRSKLNTAFHFGADACYVAGTKFGLRAYADNFDNDGLKSAVEYAHALNKKVYVTVNIFPKNADFSELKEYFVFLSSIGVDAVIMTDAGAIMLCKEVAPTLEIHLSTQANTTNGYTAKFWASQGVKRVVLAREMSIDDIKRTKDIVGDALELEVFVHGAMCISYSGRCLLSNYLSTRDSNRGECVQACRWEYKMTEASREGEPLTLIEDDKGSYVMNSKDMNMLMHLDKLIDAGVSSFKIEGRMKSEYYVASAVTAYRRALDDYYETGIYCPKPCLIEELEKTSHRRYTTGFYLGERDTICSDTSKPESDWLFIAEVKGYDIDKKCIILEQRGRFKRGDVLEVLSPCDNYLKNIVVDEVFDLDGNIIEDCKFVQQILYLKSDVVLKNHDVLRMKRKDL